MKIHRVLTLLFLILPALSHAENYALEAYKWQRLWYDNPHGNVNQNSLLPTSAVYYPERGYLFIGIKRDCQGIPATLNVIDVKKHRPGSSPPLTPYPNYELNEIPIYPTNQHFARSLPESEFGENVQATNVETKWLPRPGTHAVSISGSATSSTTSSHSTSASSSASSSSNSSSSNSSNSSSSHSNQSQSNQSQSNQSSGQSSQSHQGNQAGGSAAQGSPSSSHSAPQTPTGQFPPVGGYPQQLPGQYPQQPGQHAQQPGQNIGQYPQQPGQYPQVPGQYPQQPGQNPQQPGNYPQQPGQYPQQPGQHPQQPGQYPQQPVQNPQQPGQYPQQPGQHPQQPGNYPQQPGLNPDQHPQQPGQYPQQPGQHAQQPGQHPQQPGQYPQQPGQHAQQPGQHSQQPGQYPQQPGNYPQQPGHVQHPGQHPQQPGQYPATGPQQPGHYPATGSQQPGQYPATGPQQPGQYPQPPGHVQQPGQRPQQPGQYPATGPQQPGQYPSTGSHQPGQYPTGGSNQFGQYPGTGQYPTGQYPGQFPSTAPQNPGQFPTPGHQPGQYPQTGQSNPFFPPTNQQNVSPNQPYKPPYKPFSPPINTGNWNQPTHQNQWPQNYPGSSNSNNYPISETGNQRPDHLTGSYPSQGPSNVPSGPIGPSGPSIPSGPSAPTGQRTKSLISVSAMVIDKCDRLWLLDSGVVRYENKRSVIYRPSLWIFDLTFGERLGDYRFIRRVEFPREIVETGEGLGSITVDVRDRSSCDSATAYFTNFLDNTIGVYSFQKADAWIFQHYSFKPDNQESQFSFDGSSYTAHHGIDSISVGWRESQGYSTVFYQSFSSSGLYATSTGVLLNKSLAPKNYNRHDFKFVGYRGCNSRSPALIFDHRYGVIFFANVQSKSIKCWNVKKSLHPENIGSIPVTHDNNNQRSLSIDSRGDLWLISNGRLQCNNAPIQGDRSYSTWIYRINILDAIRGTVCDSTGFTKTIYDDEGNQYIGDDPIEDEDFYKNHLIDYLTQHWDEEGSEKQIEVIPEDLIETAREHTEELKEEEVEEAREIKIRKTNH